MAHIHRTLRLLLVLCAALSAQLALAAFPATSGTGYVTFGGHGSHPTAASATRLEACQAWATLNAWSFTEYNSVSGYCYASAYSRYTQTTTATLYTCPANSTLSGTNCTCNSGFAESGGTCVAPPTCPAAGTSAGGGRVTLTASQKSATAANGGYYYWRDDDDCVVKLSLDVCTTGDNGTTWQCAGSESYTGGYDTGAAGNGAGDGTSGTSTTASTTPPAGEENQPTVCPTGQCPGTINGVNVCKPCSGTSTKKDKVEEKQNPDGTREKNETSSKTTCTGNTCTTESTTTTTNRDASGTVTGTSSTTTTSTEDKGDYCQRNPNEPQCDDTGSFAGSCSAGFTCKGDAATCALAQEVHKRNCELNATTAASGLYDAAKDATGNVTGDNPNNSTFSVGPGSFNTTDAIGGAQCVQDINVTVWGSALSLPLSSICGPLGYIGNVLVMVSLLLAARIVTRG